MDTLIFERLRTHLWGKDRVNTVSIAGKGYSTVDLTLFQLPQNSRLDKILLIREEYKLAYDTILADTLRMAGESRSAFLITGQPGIGKTLFLFYLLVCRLQEREPVAFQLDADRFVLFKEDGGAWTLSDSMGEGPAGPCIAFQCPQGHVIHTSSPASNRWKHWVEHLSADTYIMDVWSLEELRTLLTITNLDVQHGVNLFRKFGPNTRAIINILVKPTREDIYLQNVELSAATFASRFSTAFLDFRMLDFSSIISSEIFTLRPDLSTVSRKPVLDIPTPFLCSALGLAMSQQAAAQQHSFFKMLSDYSPLRSAARWLFENYMHVCLSDPNGNPLQLYHCNDPDLLSIPNPAEIIIGSMLTTIQPPHDFYWRPQEPNYNGVDAVIRSGDNVWAIQFIISASHSRSATDGLTKVFEIMNHKTDVEWNLVIVSPKRREAEVARDRQRLMDRWTETPVYACEVPFGEINDDNLQRLQDIMDEAGHTYPMGY